MEDSLFNDTTGRERTSREKYLSFICPRAKLISFVLSKGKIDLTSFLSNSCNSLSPPYAGARAPRGGVTRQRVVLTDLQSLVDCQ
jgi:hypothetical protein